MKIVFMILLIIALILVFTVFPIWYLIQIGQAPNWAVALYIFVTIAAGSRSASK